MRPHASTKAFTLIELLTVIAIIGILAAIIIPVTAAVRESARKAQCGSNIRQLGLAMLMYAQDNKEAFPPMRSFTAPNDGIWSWILYKSKYLPARFTGWTCPTHEQKDPTVADRVAAAVSEQDFPRSYVVCGPAMAPGWNEFSARKRSTIPNPSRTFMLTEWHTTDGKMNFWQGYNASIDLVQGAFGPVSSKHADGARHFAYMDGHVGYLGMTAADDPELWGPAN